MARYVFQAFAERIRSREALIHCVRRTCSLLKTNGLKGILTRVRFLANGADAYRSWVAAHDTLSAGDEMRMRRMAAEFSRRPLISILTPVYNTNGDLLRAAIDSVLAQTYDNWELCLVDDCSTLPHVREILAAYSGRDTRIKVAYRPENGHISEASNSALALATGSWIALLDHDDLLAPQALFCVVDAINSNPDAKVIYSDEDKVDLQGVRRYPYFKPDWNYDLFLSHNMISHCGVYRTALVREVGGFRVSLEGSQDYDLALRCIERIRPSEIHHIPHVLYHWRMLPGSTALRSTEKPYAQIAAARAISEHLNRLCIRANVQIIDAGYKVCYALPEPPPLVSLIVTVAAMDCRLERCISSIRSRTSYPDYEIICVGRIGSYPINIPWQDHQTKRPEIRVLQDRPYRNAAEMINDGVAAARGSVIGLIDANTEVITPDWLNEMVALALQPAVGAVGARLWSANDHLQHAGLILGIGGVAGYGHRGLPRGHPGSCGRAALTQSVSGVTDACLIVRKDTYQHVGGLDETKLTAAFRDVDFCLKLRELGYRNVWTPHAELYYSLAPGFDETPESKQRFSEDCAYMQRRWGAELTQDPAYNPNLTLEREDFSLAFPTRAKKLWL